MINKERAKKIANLSLPIMGGMVSQNILNVVDTAMVGVLGQNALAAVGIASFMNFLAMSFLMGLGSGVQAMVARRKGEGQESKMALPLNGGLLTALALSLPATFLLIYLVPYVFPFIMNDPAVIPLGVDYLQLRLIGLAAVAANFAFRGFWNGINMSTIYFRTLIVMHALNILISYVLIFGRLGFPAMGVGGAGLGTALSTWFGALYYVILAFKHARPYGFCKELPKWDNIKTLWRVGFPASVQMFFFAGGMTTLFWIISQIGTKEVAAANVLINVMLVAILPSIGFGIAAASLVGQSLGRGHPEDAKLWGWDTVKLCMVLLFFMGLPMVIFPDLILSVFIHEEQVLAVARYPLMVFGALICFDGVGMVLLNAMQGAGDSKTVMWVSIFFQWCVFLPMAYTMAVVLKFGLFAVWVAQMIYRLLQAGFFTWLWSRGKWSRVKV